MGGEQAGGPVDRPVGVGIGAGASRCRCVEGQEDAVPQHRLCLGHVMAVQRDDIGVVDIGVGAQPAVAGEGFLERGHEPTQVWVHHGRP